MMIYSGVEVKEGQEWLSKDGKKFKVLKDIGMDLFRIRIEDLNLETVYHVSLFLKLAN